MNSELNRSDLNRKISELKAGAYIKASLDLTPCGKCSPCLNQRGTDQCRYQEFRYAIRQFDRDWTGDETASAELRNEMLVAIDTPDLLAMIGYDHWRTIQMDIYNFVFRRFDEGSDIAALYREATCRQWLKWKGVE